MAEHFTDGALGEMLVGGLQPGRVKIVPYDPAWPDEYERHRKHLVAALGDRIRLIQHIGSTSVPDLAAKPIIDIVLGVDDPDSEGAFLPDLEAIGYELRVREQGHRCLRAVDSSKAAHVHLYRPNSMEVRRYLALRDRLRTDPSDRDLYERTKRELAEREWRDLNYYAEAKGPVIQAILARSGWEE